MTTDSSLRERKKAATRAALSRAAWSLMLEHGLDAATPEAIAEAADVSPRTFRNYFASREEAIVDDLAQRYLSLADQIRTRPADEPVWDSLAAVLPSAVSTIVGDAGQLVTFMRLLTENPTLRAQLGLVRHQLTLVMTEVVAERTGTDAARDLAPRLLAGVVDVALAGSVEFWARTGTTTPLPDLIRESLAQLRAGPLT